jgi:hypothetical protein
MADDIRYRHCKQIREMLANPMMNEAMATIHVDLMNELLSTDPADKQKREDVFFESKALSRIVGRLQSMANEATVEESKLEKLKRGTFNG